MLPTHRLKPMGLRNIFAFQHHNDVTMTYRLIYSFDLKRIRICYTSPTHTIQLLQL